MPDIKSTSEELKDFFEFIWGNNVGFSYLAFKAPGNQYQFRQEFYSWPDESDKIISRVLDQRGEFEVYYAPALFSEKSALKQNVKGAQVVWVEFDGKVPESYDGIPEPSMRVLSSEEEHEHCYWRLDNFYDADRVEKINRALTYLLGADSSGWDAGQILRPINTLNHKRSRPVNLLNSDVNAIYSPDLFAGLSEPPPLAPEPVPERIPDVTEVVAAHPFSKSVWSLFKAGVPIGQRSSGLMSLGYSLAEMQLTNEEMLSVLLNADARWGKFKDRQDRVKRLLEIVTIARQKYPIVSKPKDENKLISLGFKTILATDIKVEWVWDGLLQHGGYLLLTGPSGVGKTQFSLDFSAKAALGYPFLDIPVVAPIKLGFFSLEMGQADLKQFIYSQAEFYTEDQREILEKNFRFYPLGEPLYLNRKSEKARIEEAIENEGLDGIVIDSLGSITEGELSEEKDVKNIMDWNDSLRQKYNVFTWYVHHHRKATSDNKKPNKLSDIYGSQYITARATTVLTLWDTGSPNTLEVLPLKVRLSEKPDKFTIHRDGRLQFTKKSAAVAAPVKPTADEQQALDEKKAEDEAKNTLAPGEDTAGGMQL